MNLSTTEKSMCVGVGETIVWQAEDNFEDSFLSFLLSMVSRDPAQVTRLTWQVPLTAEPYHPHLPLEYFYLTSPCYRPLLFTEVIAKTLDLWWSEGGRPHRLGFLNTCSPVGEAVDL